MFLLPKSEWLSIGKGAAVAASGAAMTYVMHWSSGRDFGPWTPIVTAGLAILANYLRKAATT